MIEKRKENKRNNDIVILQNKIFEIAVYFNDFCKSNNIEYYLMGGTALGAIRHKGFIPWDDDFDVFMTFDNYMKFLKVVKMNLDTSRFYLQEENSREWPLFYSKLRMNGTTYIEDATKYRNMHQGFFIDIMCLNNVSKYLIYRYMQYISARLVIAQTLAQRGYLTDNIIKKIGMFFSKFIVKGFIKSGLVNFMRSLNNRDTKYVGHFFAGGKFKNLVFPKVFLGIPRYVSFNSTKLPVPNQVENYLSLTFGPDYMEIPDEKTKSKYPSHVIFHDTEVDYKEYLGKKYY